MTSDPDKYWNSYLGLPDLSTDRASYSKNDTGLSSVIFVGSDFVIVESFSNKNGFSILPKDWLLYIKLHPLNPFDTPRASLFFSVFKLLKFLL